MHLNDKIGIEESTLLKVCVFFSDVKDTHAEFAKHLRLLLSTHSHDPY